MIVSKDTLGGAFRLVIAMSRQAFILGLVLHLPNAASAAVFKILALNSIFSLLIGNERYFNLISERATHSGVIVSTLIAAFLYFPFYCLALLLLVRLDGGFIFYLAIAYYSAAVFDALANMEQKIHTYLSTGPFDDILLNAYRNIAPIFVALFFVFVCKFDWVASVFLGAGVLCVRYFPYVYVYIRAPKSIDIFSLDEFKMMGAALAFRGNVLVDRLYLGRAFGDHAVVIGSIAQSVISTLGSMIDMSYTRRISNFYSRQDLGVIVDPINRAQLCRLLFHDFYQNLRKLIPPWFGASALGFIMATIYKNESFTYSGAIYFTLYFLLACFSHFIGVFALSVRLAALPLVLPLSRLIFITPLLIFSSPAFSIFATLNVLAFMVTLHLIFFGVAFAPFRISIPSPLRFLLRVLDRQ